MHVHIAYYRCRIFTFLMEGRREAPAGQSARRLLML
jgi:hypothetical protein